MQYSPDSPDSPLYCGGRVSVRLRAPCTGAPALLFATKKEHNYDERRPLAAFRDAAPRVPVASYALAPFGAAFALFNLAAGTPQQQICGPSAALGIE